MEKLPKLSLLKWASIFSFFKKPRVKPQGIFIQQNFSNISISENDLAQYAQFIGFKNANPLCYLYLLAQRAQTQLMVQPSFTLPIPGLVHLANHLEQFTAFNPNIPFTINAQIKVKPTAEIGSIKPIAQVNFYQNTTLVASCNSTYLVKKKKKNIKKTFNNIENRLFSHHFNINIPLNIGKSYSQVSGDSNPIHTQKWFAKLLGFNQPIVHGWYMVSKIVENIEEFTNSDVKTINVSFKNPVYMPTTLTINYSKNNKTIDFEAKNGEKIAIMGTLLI